MLIFGTMGKRVQVPLADGRVLLLVYRYFHIFWAVRAAFGRHYLLATPTEQGWATIDLTQDQAQSLLPGQPLPQPHPWDRFSLLGFVVLIAVFIFGSMALSSLLRH